MLEQIRYAIRLLYKNPFFALTAVLTLASGIAANTAIFSVVDALLLHPLPYPHSHELVLITKNMPMFGLAKSDASPLDFLDYRAGSRSFSQMAAIRINSVNLTGDQLPIRVFGLRVSTNLFPMLGVRPVIGRLFRPEEVQAGRDRVSVLDRNIPVYKPAGNCPLF